MNIDRDSYSDCPPIYYEKLMELHKFYSSKYTSLEQTISGCYQKIIKDQMLMTMVRDSTTMPFIEERVRELFKEIVENEREILIEKLGLKCNELTFKCKQLQRVFSAYKKDVETHQQQNYKQKTKFETEKTGIHGELKKRESELEEIKLQLKEKAFELANKQRINEQLEDKINYLKEENMKIRIEFEKKQEQIQEIFGEQNNKFQLKDFDLKESQKKIGLLQHNLKEIEIVNEQKLQVLEKKYRKKVNEYKLKIEEYKAKILQLVNSQRSKQVDENLEMKVQQLSKKLASTTRQSQRKITELKSLKEKDKLEMEKKYESKYKELQTYYERLLEEKVGQAQKQVEEAGERIKQQQDQLRKYIDFLEQNSVPLQQSNKLQQYYENLKELLESKILEHEKTVSFLENDNKQLAIVAEQWQKSQQECQNKLNQAECMNNELKNKLKGLENQVGMLKSGEKKMKSMQANNQQIISEKQDENIILRSELQKLRSENTELFGIINEKQNLLVLKTNENEQLERKNTKLDKQKREIEEELQKNEGVLGTSKKILTEKENSIQALTQDSQFKIETLNAQIHKSSLTIEIYTEKMKQMSNKLSILQADLLNSAKEKSEIETLLRKVELENKYVKESQVSLREQHETYVNDYKKKTNQKNKVIEELEAEVSELKKVHNQLALSNEQKCKKLRQIIKKINKTYSIELQNLNRCLRDIRVHVESTGKLIQSQGRIFQSNTTLKLKEQMFIIYSQKNEQLRKLKEGLEHEKSQQIQMNKSKSQKIEAAIKQKLQIELRNFETVIASKEREIQGLERQRRRIMSEKDQIQQKVFTLQKGIKDLEIAIENGKITNKSKVNELLVSFDAEKDKMINQYGSRREKQEEEVLQLTKSLKNMKKQLEGLQTQNEQLRLKLISEQNSLTAREKGLQKEIERKKMDSENLTEQLKNVKQNNTRLESENKALMEKISGMNQSLAESEFKNHQLSGELTIYKTKVDRLTEQTDEIKRDLTSKECEKEVLERSKKKMQSELKQIKSTIHKSNKSHELKILQQFDLETKDLSSKVSQLRKVHLMMGTDRTPLRS